jgi:hypothetical protein
VVASSRHRCNLLRRLHRPDSRIRRRNRRHFSTAMASFGCTARTRLPTARTSTALPSSLPDEFVCEAEEGHCFRTAPVSSVETLVVATRLSLVAVAADRL